MKRRKPQFYRMACRGCGAQAGMSSAEGGELTTAMCSAMTRTIAHLPTCPSPRAAPFIDKRPPWPPRIVVSPVDDSGLAIIWPGTVPLREEVRLIVETSEGLRLGELGEHQGLLVEWVKKDGVRFWAAKRTSEQ